MSKQHGNGIVMPGIAVQDDFSRHLCLLRAILKSLRKRLRKIKLTHLLRSRKGICRKIWMRLRVTLGVNWRVTNISFCRSANQIRIIDSRHSLPTSHYQRVYLLLTASMAPIVGRPATGLPKKSFSTGQPLASTIGFPAWIAAESAAGLKPSKTVLLVEPS